MKTKLVTKKFTGPKRSQFKRLKRFALMLFDA